MKLIYCPECGDVRKLFREGTVCRCGHSWGEYLDPVNARIGGKAIPLGIGNSSLETAIKHRPLKGQGHEFLAFVIPEECAAVEVEND